MRMSSSGREKLRQIWLSLPLILLSISTSYSNNKNTFYVRSRLRELNEPTPLDGGGVGSCTYGGIERSLRTRGLVWVSAPHSTQGQRTRRERFPGPIIVTMIEESGHSWLIGRKLRTYMGYTNLMFYVYTQEQMTEFYKLIFFLYSLIVFIETCIMRTRGRVGSNTNFPREDVQESHIFWKQWPGTCERVYWCGYCTKKKLHVLSGFCSSWPCLPGPREF